MSDSFSTLATQLAISGSKRYLRKRYGKLMVPKGAVVVGTIVVLGGVAAAKKIAFSR